MRTVSGDLLTHEVIKTSKTFYRNQDLEVRIGGDTAATNGKMVMLPSIPTGVDYTPDEVAVVRGFVDHEAGHGRHTNFALAKRKQWKDMLKRYAHFMPIANGLEDVRIERLITQEYPGSQRNLEATSAWANNLYLEAYAEDPEIAKDIARVGAIGITWEGRRRMGYDDPTLQQCLDTLPKAIRKQVNDAVDTLDKAKSTADCFKTSQKLLKKWGLDHDRVEQEEKRAAAEQAAREEREQQQQAQQQQGDEGDGTDAETTQGQQEPDGQTEDEGVDGASGRSNGDDSDGEGEETEVQTRDHGLPDEPAEAFDPNLDKVMSSITGKAASADGSYTAINSHFDVHAHPNSGCSGEEYLGAHMRGSRWGCSYEDVVKSIGSRLNKIRRNVERALVSTQERTWRGGYEEGQLDGRALVRGMTGSANIYRRRQDTPELDTSVMLILDGSGSMSGEPATLACQATVALAEVFEKVGIPFAVASFDTQAHEAANRKREYKRTWYDWNGRGRGHAISTYLLKPYEMPLRQARKRIAAYQSMTTTGSGNTDGDSIMHIFQAYVRPRPEKRKIVLCMSDGEPVGTDHHAEHKRLQKVVESISKDADVVGLGICHDVSDYYANNVSVHSVDQLANETMKKVAQMLLGKRFKADAREAS